MSSTDPTTTFERPTARTGASKGTLIAATLGLALGSLGGAGATAALSQNDDAAPTPAPDCATEEQAGVQTADAVVAEVIARYSAVGADAARHAATAGLPEGAAFAEERLALHEERQREAELLLTQTGSPDALPDDIVAHLERLIDNVTALKTLRGEDLTITYEQFELTHANLERDDAEGLLNRGTDMCRPDVEAFVAKTLSRMDEDPQLEFDLEIYTDGQGAEPALPGEPQEPRIIVPISGVTAGASTSGIVAAAVASYEKSRGLGVSDAAPVRAGSVLSADPALVVPASGTTSLRL